MGRTSSGWRTPCCVSSGNASRPLSSRLRFLGPPLEQECSLLPMVEPDAGDLARVVDIVGLTRGFMYAGAARHKLHGTITRQKSSPDSFACMHFPAMGLKNSI